MIPSRMDFEKCKSNILKTQFYKNVRIWRAQIIRGKKLRRMQSSQFQAVSNSGNVEHRNPKALKQKHARFMRMLAIRHKRLRSNPPTASTLLHSLQSLQIDYPMSFNELPLVAVEDGCSGATALCKESASTLQKDNLISFNELPLATIEGCSGATSLCEGAASSEKTVKDSPKDVKGTYVGVDEENIMEDTPETTSEDEELADVWKDMEFAMESCKETLEEQLSDEHGKEEEDDDNCSHSFILKDDIGSVCRVCGLVQKEIQNIFEFIYPKRTRTKTYGSEPQKINYNRPDEALPDWCQLPTVDVGMTEVSAHAMHMKQMKPNQMEGFKFLLKNLMTDEPHGCVLAHAPGSGKTFMIICFVQSFLAKYPTARPLVILPKGILGTWKKEFQKWQLEEINLYDFYSMKANTRSQQLAVLKKWVEQKSVLFLGYKQFSSIVTSYASGKEMATCQEILVKAPTILILDEGHTPRNKETDTLESLTRIQTPRKVVLSGTLYQNHVNEVFNILNLVHPRFLKLEANRAIVRRIMSKVDVSVARKQLRGAGDVAFYDLVENTLLNDEIRQRKVGIIKDLREMTSNVLHYYKGDSFDELPGLVDFTVLLKLSPKQRADIEELAKLKERKFRSSSLGSAIYMHPKLKQHSGSSDEIDNETMDQLLENMIHKDGVKTVFFLNMLRLCEISKEKLLVFSHYLLPLKFLERLAMHVKGWAHGREIFMITGKSTAEHREWSMEHFNSSPNAKVFFGSIKACGEGISLVGASRILILDVHPNPSVSWQAVCRAFRPGQLKMVYNYRLVAADSPEEEDHSTCFKKELIAKLWFEWDGHSRQQDFEFKAIDTENCGDTFLQNPLLGKDIKTLYKR